MTDLLDLNQAQQIVAGTDVDSSLQNLVYAAEVQRMVCASSSQPAQAGTEQNQCQAAKSKCVE